MTMKRFTRAEIDKKLSKKEREKSLPRLLAMPDDQIDTSDIPELTREQFKQMIPSQMFWQKRRRVPVRIEHDIAAWLKQSGYGCAQKANALLRRAMLRSKRNGN